MAREIQICPSAFVIPEYPFLNNIQWVNGTTCAQKCISPVWTDSEWNMIRLVGQIIMWFGLPLDIIVILTWILSTKKRGQYLVLTFAILSILSQSTLYVSYFYPLESVFCSSNATPVSPDDGYTLCNFQSLIFLYACDGACFSWMIQSIDLYFKVVLKRRNTRQFATIYLFFIFICPLFMVVAAIVTRSYGYQPGGSICLLDGFYSTFFAYLWVFVALVIGGFCVFSVIGTIILHNLRLRAHVSSDSGSTTMNHNLSQEMFRMVKGVGLFVFILICISIKALLSPLLR